MTRGHFHLLTRKTNGVTVAGPGRRNASEIVRDVRAGGLRLGRDHEREFRQGETVFLKDGSRIALSICCWCADFEPA